MLQVLYLKVKELLGGTFSDFYFLVTNFHYAMNAVTVRSCIGNARNGQARFCIYYHYLPDSVESLL
jgi:hypothetical protein